jgi:hypothetical protein
MALRRRKEVIKSARIFLSFTLTVSIFGASIFMLIVSEIADSTKLSANERLEETTVRKFLAISWMLFVLALGVGGVSTNLLIGSEKNDPKKNDPEENDSEENDSEENDSEENDSEENEKNGSVRLCCLILLLQSLIIGAFFFLSLVTVAYTGSVGWVAVAFSSVAEIIAVIYFSYRLYQLDAMTSTVEYFKDLSLPMGLCPQTDHRD